MCMSLFRYTFFFFRFLQNFFRDIPFHSIPMYLSIFTLTLKYTHRSICVQVYFFSVSLASPGRQRKTVCRYVRSTKQTCMSVDHSVIVSVSFEWCTRSATAGLPEPASHATFVLIHPMKTRCLVSITNSYYRYKRSFPLGTSENEEASLKSRKTEK